MCFCSCCVSKGSNEERWEEGARERRQTLVPLVPSLIDFSFDFCSAFARLCLLLYEPPKKHTHQKPAATLVKVDLQSATKQLRNVREMGYTSWNEQFEPLPTTSTMFLGGRGWGRGS